MNIILSLITSKEIMNWRCWHQFSVEMLRGLALMVCSMGLLLVLQMPYRGADAVCCKVNRTMAAIAQSDLPACNDGTVPPFGECCGVGRCNVFCCNCLDGCRQRWYTLSIDDFFFFFVELFLLFFKYNFCFQLFTFDAQWLLSIHWCFIIFLIFYLITEKCWLEITNFDSFSPLNTKILILTNFGLNLTFWLILTIKTNIWI